MSGIEIGGVCSRCGPVKWEVRTVDDCICIVCFAEELEKQTGRSAGELFFLNEGVMEQIFPRPKKDPA